MEQYGWQLTTIAVSLSIVAVGMVVALIALIFLAVGTTRAVKHLDRLMDQVDYFMNKARLWTVEVEEKARHAGAFVDSMGSNLKTFAGLLATIIAGFKGVSGLGGGRGRKGRKRGG